MRMSKMSLVGLCFSYSFKNRTFETQSPDRSWLYSTGVQLHFAFIFSKTGTLFIIFICLLTDFSSADYINHRIQLGPGFCVLMF